jgi:ribokinase
VIGSANLDFTVALPRLPRVGETVSAGTLLVNRGGKGANQAVAARRLGAEVRMIGCVGDDESGALIRRGLAAEGIGVDGLATAPGVATGTALIFVDREGRNQIGVAPGANHSLTVEMARGGEDAIGWAEVVVCQLEVPMPVVRWALEAVSRCATSIRDGRPRPGSARAARAPSSSRSGRRGRSCSTAPPRCTSRPSR